MSNKKVFYKQCHLVKTIPTGTKHQTSWIPEEFAKLNHIVKLRDEDGVWEDGWKVVTAGNHIVEESALPDWHKLIRGHHKATGDSLPKEN